MHTYTPNVLPLRSLQDKNMANLNQQDTLQTLFKDSISKHGNLIAYSYPTRGAMTFEEVGEKAHKLMFYLAGQGIGKGDKIALLSENMPHWGVTYFSVVSMGAVVVPILVDFSPKEINTILAHSDTKVLFISSKIYRKYKDKLDFQGRVLITDTFETLNYEGNEVDQYCKEHPQEFKQYVPTRVKPEDLASIIYTSGTTGRSKGVMLSHKNLFFEARQLTSIQDVTPQDTYLSILPLAHTYECTIGLIMGMDGGARTVYLDKAPTPSNLIPIMQEIRPTIMLTVPLIMEKIFKSKVKPTFTTNKWLKRLYQFRPTQKLLHQIAGKKLYQTFGGRLRFFGIGGAALAPETELFLRDCKFPYSCGYGLTETAPLLAGASVKTTSYRSVGPAVPGIELCIDNPNPTTGEGEIIARGANIMSGYYKDLKMTQEVLTQDGWFHTGDLGVLRNGQLYIKGRIKNMILGPSGENIYPEEIEAVLNRMNYVTDSLVYQWKGKLIARVTLNQEEWMKKYEEIKTTAQLKQVKYQEHINLYLQELKDAVNEEFGKYSQLSQVILQPIPFEKTPTMKIKRYLYCPSNHSPN